MENRVMYATKENILDTRTWRDFLHSYSKLVRPAVVLMGITNGLVGIFYAGLTVESLSLGIMALVSIAAIAAFSYGYNQLTDLEEDQINAPNRPLVTGELSVKECHLFLAFMLGLSVLPLLLFGRFLALLLMLAGPVFSGITYSRFRVKGTIIKPFFVAFGWAFVPMISYATVTNHISPAFLILLPFFLILMFLTTTMGDLRDVEGDKANNVKSLPVVFGIPATVTNLQIYTMINYSLLILGILLQLLPIDSLLGLCGGYLIFRYLRTPNVLTRQKGMKRSLARFSWVTSLGLILGRIIVLMAMIFSL